ncbi:hypothetical protein [Sulfitobacter aestuariivivens]
MFARRKPTSKYTTGAFGIDWIVITANALGVAVVVFAASNSPANQGPAFDNNVIASAETYASE